MQYQKKARRHRGKTGYTLAKSLKPICPGGISVHHSGVLVKTLFVCVRTARCHPCYPWFMPDHHDLSWLSTSAITVCPSATPVNPVFDISPGLPQMYLRFPGLPQFFRVCHGRSTVLSQFVTVHPFIKLG